MGKPSQLTDKDWETIRRALNDAMEDRASFADSYGGNGPEVVAALNLVKRYEKLHQKLFGSRSQRQQLIDADASHPTVSIFELMDRK